jgi:protoporphyrinogen oxidase
LGGLCSSYQWQDLIWDRFYHVFLSADSLLVEFVTELNLHSELFWQETKVGFYGDGKLVSLSSTLDFITFPFMSLWQKFRMGLGILYCNRIKDPTKLDKIHVRHWLTKVFGRQVYEKIWDPLLRSKLGEAKEKTSAAFIWAPITRLYGARSSGSKREKMGHVHGGYHTILKAAEKRLSELGARVVLNTPVSKVEVPGSPSLEESSKTQLYPPVQGNGLIHVLANDTELEFDKVLFTVPCPLVLQILGDLPDHPYWQQLRQVEYLSIACVFLVLTRRLSPYYTINLLDKDLPFTGIIEITNVVSPEDLGGKHLVYLPKYMPHDDPMNTLKDEQIIEFFVAKLKKVFPDLKDEEILHTQIFREMYDQPLQELNYLDRVTGFRTPLPGVYLVNTAMIYNSTLNNNAVITLAKNAAATILNDTTNEQG